MPARLPVPGTTSSYCRSTRLPIAEASANQNEYGPQEQVASIKPSWSLYSKVILRLSLVAEKAEIQK